MRFGHTIGERERERTVKEKEVVELQQDTHTNLYELASFRVTLCVPTAQAMITVQIQQHNDTTIHTAFYCPNALRRSNQKWSFIQRLPAIGSDKLQFPFLITHIYSAQNLP